jgi:glucose-6-phosphate isomerase
LEAAGPGGDGKRVWALARRRRPKEDTMLHLDTSRIAPHLSADEVTKETAAAVAELSSLLRREGPGADMLAWLDLPRVPRHDLEKIVGEAKRIQDSNDCLVLIGIGGSYLGARAAIEALPLEARFPVIFAGMNLSPEYHARILEHLEGKRFAVCVVSKSGTTLEPAIALRLFRERLIKRLGAEKACKRIVAVTDPEGGVLRRMADREGYTSFDVPKGVGGRFSVLSAVGLFPCAVSGLPILDMIEGARAAHGAFTRADAANDAARYAAIRNLLYRKGTKIEVLSAFHPELASFCDWWKQLAGESEGKEGKGLYPASTVMTTDLHSLGQYLQQGSRDILETFLVASHPRAELAIPADNADLDGLNYIAGKGMSSVNKSAFEGTRDAHAAGGLPVLTVEVPAVTPDSLGSLFMYFEIAIAVSGRLLGINPFDQPGVEEYKKRMFSLLGKRESA